MLKNYLKIAWRNLLCHRIFSLINILGLAIGMAACLLILQYVSFEKSYDSFNQNEDNLYRVTMQHSSSDGQIFHLATNYAPTAPALKAAFPEVKESARAYLSSGEVFLLTYRNKVFSDDKLGFADEAFLSMFSYPLLKGDVNTALSAPNTIILTESMAKKYFGNEDPMGKMLNLKEGDTNLNVQVTGILKDIPLNSHLQFSSLVSFKTFIQEEKEIEKNWGWSGFYTYILIPPGTDPQILETKFNQLLEKQKGKYFKSAGVHEKFFVQPVKDIHLHSDLIAEQSVNGNARMINFWLLIACFIGAIAWFNYINLSTARAIERAKEVGVRKVSGASRFQLIRQFLFESFLLNLISIVFAVIIVLLFLPLFDELIGKEVSAQIWRNPHIWITISSLFLAGTIAAGLYPAFILSSFQPVKVLKGRLVHTAKGAYLRKSLVVLQFAISIALIIGTFTVYRQIRFMRDSDLGININQTLVVNAPFAAIEDSVYKLRFRTFQTEVLKTPGVTHATSSDFTPGNMRSINQWGGYIRRVDSQPTDAKTYQISGIDYNFLPAFQVKLLAGRNFSPEFPTDKQAVVVSREAVRQLGFRTAEEAVGKKIYYPIRQRQDGRQITIIGVMDDFHVESLQKTISPIILELNTEQGDFFSFKVNPSQLNQLLPVLKRQFETAFPGNPFQYFFMDEQFEQQYKGDQQFEHVFGFFAGLAIFIACMGLFGLVSFSTTQRTKEIGVRKVLGASVASILSLLSKDFMRSIFLANVIAWPLAYYALSKWLQDYAYKIDLISNLWVFILAGLAALIIMLFTVSFQSIKAALANPVNSLRSE